MRRLPFLIIILSVATTAALGACGSGSDVAFGRGTLSIRTSVGLVSIPVEVADSEAERERGLMGRHRLASDAGMAFVFDQPTDVGFWMKDTLIRLDIAYWTKGGRIVSIRHMRPCREDPCPTYPPGTSYVGAVETNSGFFDQMGVRVGDRVHLITSST